MLHDLSLYYGTPSLPDRAFDVFCSSDSPSCEAMQAPVSTSISYSDPTTRITKRRNDPYKVVIAASSSCMDLRGRAQNTPDRQQVRSRPSDSSLQPTAPPSRTSPQPYSSPLPQTQWSEIPLPYRPRNWTESREEPFPALVPDPSYVWRLRPSTPDTGSRNSQAQPTSRTRRRPQGIRNLLGREDDETRDQPMDVSMLYPQMSPYEDRFSSYSAPDDLEFYHTRSVSQPPTASFTSMPSDFDDLPSLSIPRSPTYPPAGRRRMHSATGVGDAAFADEQEFRLFVEATAGLGPEQTFRNHQPYSSSTSSQRRPRHDSSPQPRQQLPPNSDTVSPLEETPTTMYALQQLASMPQASQEPQRQRLNTSASGLDLWLQPPGATPPTRTSVHDVSPLEELGRLGHLDDDDDELPDYAESQAQAQAHQRAEASRRAQELQRRWQQSGSRRGL